ncbi:MFS general substrate transporter [Gonapodya prolifera JEL478]|uniref:MFS general substrate transporter n=1 Tax=Gonapodya prolifera (strain JEL478) TaxID=1344416 RepID=A0A138ZZ97_GONPJ|nr:MFS general substrate transporter [Gonapodya prolifera JEL478]|eukprot:KXS09829.1 MFS general substrate transporter [Gonapodya prolifera JEL478]
MANTGDTLSGIPTFPPDESGSDNTRLDAESAEDSAEKKDSTKTALDDFPEGGYGWVIVAAAIVINVVAIGEQITYGIFQRHYTAHQVFPGATNLTVAIVGGVGVALLPGLGPLSGRLADRFGYARTAFIGGLIQALGYLLASFSSTLWHIFLTQSFLVPLGWSLSYFPAMSVIPHWFLRRRGAVTGIVAAGCGAGGLVLAPTLQAIIDASSFRWALRFLAAASGVCVCGAAVLIRTRFPSRPRGRVLDLSVFGNWTFTRLFLTTFVSCFGFFAPGFFLNSYAIDKLGASNSIASITLSINAVGQSVGRVIWGLAAKRIGYLNLYVILQLVPGLLCWCLWANATTLAVLLLFSFLFGMFAGGFVIINPLLIPDLFGYDQLASILGMIFCGFAPGIAAGPVIMGAILDGSATTHEVTNPDGSVGVVTERNYLTAIMVCGSFWIASLGFVGWLRFEKAGWKVWKRV